MNNQQLIESLNYYLEDYKEYYQNNKEKEAKRRADWYQANKERIKAQQKVYRQNNKEKQAKRYKRWYQANKEKAKIYNQNYREINKQPFVSLDDEIQQYYQTNKDAIEAQKAAFRQKYRDNK